MNIAAISPNTSDDTDDGFVAKPTILRITTYSDTTLWRRVRAGDFPAPIRISPGRVAWLKRDVKRWIQERASA